MNPETPTPREELEMRITALLLGQLSPEDEAALRGSLSADPELQRLHDQLRQAIGLVRETVASPGNEGLSPLEEPKLSKGRREKLLATFKTVRPEEIARRAQRRVQRRELTLVAAMIVGLMAAAGILVNMRDESTVDDFEGGRNRRMLLTRSDDYEAARGEGYFYKRKAEALVGERVLAYDADGAVASSRDRSGEGLEKLSADWKSTREEAPKVPSAVPTRIADGAPGQVPASAAVANPMPTDSPHPTDPRQQNRFAIALPA